ncbi:hypothetical protein [Pseudomonas sp. TWP3-1]|uniref:hypothetical protein n=1 Tax=Pseudomonas sp. TWP3-1 TaxID=2804631 RepID=UPI003CFB80EA
MELEHAGNSRHEFYLNDEHSIKTRVSEISLCLAFMIFLTGCTSTSERRGYLIPEYSANAQTVNVAVVPPAPAPAITPEPLAKGKPLNLTPLSGFDDDWGYEGADGENFSDSYTRLLILSDIPAYRHGDAGDAGDSLPVMGYEKRGWLSRFLVGRDFSINLTASVTVGGFESTIPLATVGHVSDSNGEQWNRVIHHSKANFPLFLVKADGSASVPVVKLTVNGTQSYSSRGAAAAVQVALGVARASAGSASVITRLSEQATRDKARAIDDAISRLFSSGVTEEHWTDRDLRFWRAGNNNAPQGVKVSFHIPNDTTDWNSAPSPVGNWIITFDHPRPSIFSDWRVCSASTLPRCAKTRRAALEKIHKEIDVSQVLNYKLTSDPQGLGSIKAFISQQDWYTSAQLSFMNPLAKKAAADAFCRRVLNEVGGLGLNGTDARIVLWSVVKGLPMAGDVDFLSVSSCNDSLSEVEADRA